MATTTTTDPTFRNYQAAQAKKYDVARPGYSPALYEHLFARHAATGGQFGCVVDVGCGPGSATRGLAPAFERAFGLDPGAEMINVARERGGDSKGGEPIRYELSEAENIADAPGLGPGQVDMITSATAAHWFDMKQFWPQAARLLRTGGTVAFWIRGTHRNHPDMPHAPELNGIQTEFWDTISPYFQPGNVVAHDMYRELELPWMADPAQTAFPQAQYQRFEWDFDGLSDGKDFFGGSREVPIEYFRYGMSTASAVTRWREAHPDLAGTDRDCVEATYAKVKEVLGEGAKMRVGAPTVLMVFKKT